MVKDLLAMKKTWVQSLGWEDPPEKNSFPLQYSCLENSMDRGAWQATVRGVTKSQTQLSNFTFHSYKFKVTSAIMAFSKYFHYLENSE